MVELRTLGVLDLRDGNGAEIRSVLQQPKRLALLAFLTISVPRRYHRRDSLLAMFWPDLDTQHARAALRRTLHFLRAALGADAIRRRSEEEVSISAEELWSDTAAFENSIRAGDLTGALELYRGELLGGFHVPDAPEFQGWLEQERYRIRDAAVRAAWSLAEAAEREHRSEEASRWGQRALALTPEDEGAVRRLLALLNRTGERSTALHVYDDFARRLALESDLKPPPDLLALIDTIRAQRTPEGPPPAGSSCPAASIAVLPFLNLSADPENEYFSVGMTEEILDALTRLGGLKVASRTSVFAIQRDGLDIRAIAERLNVRTVLEGSVRRSGGRVRITAQLINAADGYHLWSNTYDRETGDVFAVQEDISRAIVAALESRLVSAVPANPIRHTTTNVQAYELYLKGRFFWNARTPEGLQRAVGYFEQAIESDPAYPLPYAGLADVYHLLALYGIVRSADAYPKARSAATRALAIDDTLAEGHASLACVAFVFDWDWTTAEHEFRRALELDPRYIPALHWYAWFLIAMNRRDEAVEIITHAVAAEPLSLIVLARAAHIYYYAGRPREGLRYCQRALEVDPNFAVTYEVLALIYSRLGRWEEAVEAVGQVGTRPPSRAAPILMPYVHATVGRLHEARIALDALGFDLQARNLPHGYLPLWVCATHAMLGDLETAFRWLALMHEERSFGILLCHTEPGFANMRVDGRFDGWLQRVGLPASTCNADRG